MKDKKFKTFSVIRLSFAVLMIGEALFLIYCAVTEIETRDKIFKINRKGPRRIRSPFLIFEV